VSVYALIDRVCYVKCHWLAHSLTGGPLHPKILSKDVLSTSLLVITRCSPQLYDKQQPIFAWWTSYRKISTEIRTCIYNMQSYFWLPISDRIKHHAYNTHRYYATLSDAPKTNVTWRIHGRSLALPSAQITQLLL